MHWLLYNLHTLAARHSEGASVGNGIIDARHVLDAQHDEYWVILEWHWDPDTSVGVVRCNGGGHGRHQRGGEVKGRRVWGTT